MRFTKVTIMLALLLSLAMLAGCVDVPTDAPPPIEVNAEYRFLNADESLGSVSISFDEGPSVSSLGFAQPNSHQVFPAGARIGTLSNGEEINVAMTTDQRATILLLPQENNFRIFLKLIERRIFDSATLAPEDITLGINDSDDTHVADTTMTDVSVGRYRVVHAVSGVDANVTIQGANTDLGGGFYIDNHVALSGVSYKDMSDYIPLMPGDYTVTITNAADDSEILSQSITIGTGKKTSVIVSGSGGASFVNLDD